MTALAEDAPHKEITYKIIGAAMKIHNDLGAGYKEDVYEKALEAALSSSNLKVKRQYPVEVYYEGSLVALFYIDLFVEDKVIVELKSLSHPITNDEKAQVINYLKATKAKVGLILNFAPNKLEYKRIFPGNHPDIPVQRTGRDNRLESLNKHGLRKHNSGSKQA